MSCLVVSVSCLCRVWSCLTVSVVSDRRAVTRWRSSDPAARSDLSAVLLPLPRHLACESAAAHFDVEPLVGSADSEPFQQAACRLVVRHVYAIVRLVSQDA